MTPIKESIINKKTKNKPIWLMRQAGRYLPEFRKIRKLNPNFINLCLNDNLSSKITLQPLQRFKLDAAIIFSDILMIPYGLNQEVKFKKNFGPELGSLNLDKISNINEIDFLKKLDPIYKSIKKVKKNILTNRWFTDEFLTKHPDLVKQRLDQVVKTDENIFLNVFRIYAKTEMASWLSEVIAPSLVLTGEQDGGCNPRLNKFIADNLKNSKLVILPKYKHSLLIEAPDEVTKNLIQFMSKFKIK